MTGTFNNENTYLIDRGDVAMWVKAEKTLFKRVEDHLKKLEKNKESFVIHWLKNKNIVVVTKSSTKEFHYLDPSE
jgi:hypothetical protein